MYKLYKQPNGQLKQVPINEPQEDLQFPNPLEAKGQEQTVAPFVIQEQKQFDIIKENESQQARFQSKQLNQNNLQVFNFRLSDLTTSTSNSAFKGNYNVTQTTGNVTDCIMFAESLSSDKAIYYNILDLKCNLRYGGNANLERESYVEFYLLENIPSSTTSIGRKISRKQNVRGTSSGTITWSTSNAEQNYQSITTNISQDNTNVTTMLGNGYRASGLALKRIDLNFRANEDISTVELQFYVTVDINSASTVY